MMLERLDMAMSHVVYLEADQLRYLAAHVAGLLADKDGTWEATSALRRIADRLDDQTSTPRLAVIAERVARKHGITLDTLRGGSSVREFAWARQEAMYEMWGIRDPDGSRRFSLAQIGRYLGNRHHTTVLDGCRAQAERLRKATAREAARSAA